MWFNKRKNNIDLLITEFWKNGYSTLSRKFGKYLPEPPKIGDYEIDILAKRGKDFAIGLSMDSSDLTDLKILEKIRFLASRRMKYSRKPVTLILGIPIKVYKQIRELIDSLELDVRKNIKPVALIEPQRVDLFSPLYEDAAEDQYLNAS